MTKKNISLTIFVFSLGVLLIGGVLYATTKVVYRDQRIEKEIEALKFEEGRIKNDNQVLQDRIAYFETPEFQEKVAKEKLNLQRPDENVVIIKPSKVVESVDSAENLGQVAEEKAVPNYKKWWNYFFSYNN